jgi:hypothetical protein
LAMGIDLLVVGFEFANPRPIIHTALGLLVGGRCNRNQMTRLTGTAGCRFWMLCTALNPRHPMTASTTRAARDFAGLVSALSPALR